MGAVAAGFQDNFAYGTISLTTNTYLQLVDQSKNSTGTGPEAVYVNELSYPDGATLDLNGLNLYVRGSQIGSTATILNGTITQVPGGGPLTQAMPTASDLAAVGAVDDWTFFGRLGETVSIAVNPGSGGTPAGSHPSSAGRASNC